MKRLTDDQAVAVLLLVPDRTRLKQVERWLREHFPTVAPVVRVRMERIAGDNNGECWPIKGGLAIRVERELPRQDQIEVLHHEWAHAMTYPSRYLQMSYQKMRKQPHPDHPDEFWLAYGRIYRK